MANEQTILGIHKTLFVYTFIVMILGVLVAAMGSILVANVLIPQLFGEVKGLSSKIAFLGFGSLLAAFGTFLAIYTPLRSLKNTRVVLYQVPELVEVTLSEEIGSDSTSLYIAFKDKHYLAKHPAWLQKTMLAKPLAAKGYFDSNGELIAIELEEGFIWILNLSNPLKRT